MSDVRGTVYDVCATLLLGCMLVCTDASAASRLIFQEAKVDEQVGIYWRDNDHILYLGYPPVKAERSTHFSDRLVFLLNINTGVRSGLADADSRAGFCFSGGRIRYSRGGLVLYGPIGKETPATGRMNEPGIDSWVRCGIVELPIAAKYPEFVVPLREEHGILEMRFAPGAPRTSCQHDCEIYLWKPGATEPVKVQNYTLWNARNLLAHSSAFGVYYAPFNGAYFNEGYSPRDGKPVRQIAWWLYPDGRTEAIPLPEPVWRETGRTNYVFMPARDGVLAHVAGPENRVFFFRRVRGTYAAPEVLFEGVVWRAAVAPDGCRLAIVTGAMSIPNDDPSHIEVLELCGRK